MLSGDVYVSDLEQHSCTTARVRRHAFEQSHCSTKPWTSPPLPLARKLKRGTRILAGGRRGFPWRRCSHTRRRRMSSWSTDGRCKAGKHEKSVDETFTRMVLARCSPTACLACLLQTSLDVIAMLPPDLILLKNYANLHKPRPLCER